MNKDIKCDDGLDVIRSIVDGNRIHKNDVIPMQHTEFNCNIDLQITWSFDTREKYEKSYSKYSKKTNYIDDRYTNQRKDEYQSQFNNYYIDQVFDEININSITDLNKISNFYDKELGFIFNDVKEIYYTLCSNCKGRGYNSYTKAIRTTRLNCPCSGMFDCHMCHGNKYNIEGPTKYEEVITSCKDCNGYGCFSHNLRLYSLAIPEIKLHCKSSEYEKDLQKEISEMNCYDVVHYIKFKHNNISDSDDAPIFNYTATILIHKVTFRIATNVYTFVYIDSVIENTIIPVVIPNIFDDLFHEELTEINKIYTDKNVIKLTSGKATQLLNHYLTLPALNEALQILPEDNNIDVAANEISEEAFNGCISHDAAKRFAETMLEIRKVLSPTHSKLSWFILMIVPIIYFFLNVENHLETQILSMHNLLVYITLMCICSCLFIIIYSPFVALVSCGLTIYNRRKIPQELKLKMRNFKPLPKYLLITCLAIIAAVVYGVIVRIFPNLRLNEYIPLNECINNINDLLIYIVAHFIYTFNVIKLWLLSLF